MQREIIVVSVQVNTKGERVYFEVILPADTVRIDGIETGIRNMNGDSLEGNIAGTLQLQAVRKPNQCYQTVIRIGNSNMEETILGFESQFSKSFVGWMTQPYVAGAGRQEADDFRLNGRNPLYGCYQDTAGSLSQKDISYTVDVYLHTIRKD